MISVIVPTFNRQEMVVACVQSILEQSWPDIEIVVVDNLSTDLHIPDQTGRLVQAKLDG
jgi:glycosyltransferase involved in cell wall biosynthesis